MRASILSHRRRANPSPAPDVDPTPDATAAETPDATAAVWTELASEDGPDARRRTISGLDDILGLVLLAVLVVVVIIEVIGRYVPSWEIAFSDQILPDLLVWLVMVGTASAVRRNDHLGMSALGDRLRGQARTLLRAFIRAIEAAFFVILLVEGVNIINTERAQDQMSPAGYPSWLITLALPVGSGLALLNIAIGATQDVLRSRQK